MKILVTGSRDWDDPEEIERWLAQVGYGHREVTLVSGHCPNGADKHAEDFAYSQGWDAELHPADWATYGKRAGFLRNQQMVDAGADVCLAFRKNGSKGTTHCGQAAEKAGIPTYWIEEES